MRFHIIAMAALGKGLSGGDRIFIELSKKLKKNGHEVTVYVWEEGFKMCQSQNLTDVKFVIWSGGRLQRFGFFLTYVFRIINSIFRSLFLKLDNNSKTIIYSASDFWMDSLPGWILKTRFPKTIWVGTFYLTAPSPFSGFTENAEKQIPAIKNTIYYLLQKLPLFLIRHYSDLVCVTSDPDIEKFPNHKRLGKYLVIKGGVNIKGDNYSGAKNKVYDAVFQGRFHQQKGVLELIEIWRRVVNKIPTAKLAMIGDGPLMKSVKLKVKSENLEKKVKFFGYVFDGLEKNRIFKQSKIVVHPAIYDSGGMAPAEAMAVGLPGVSFDLRALRSYYPYGLLKAGLGDLDDFAAKIIKLLENKLLYKRMSNQAIKMINSEWSWEHRAEQFLDKLNEVTRL